jgi:hypothetical protein
MNSKIEPWRPGTQPQAGHCYSAMPNTVYHSFKDWYSSTMIKHVLRSVESFFYEIEQPSKNSIAFERGAAFHVGVESLATRGDLSLFDLEVIECPTKTIDSKAWKNLKEENPDKVVLPTPEIEKARQMAQKLYEKAGEVNYFVGGYAELSFFWIDKETGLQLKCRLDWFRPDANGWITDYKSSKAPQLESFAKDIAIYNYHFSAAMYLEGLFRVLGIIAKHWHFLVIANTPPFEVEAYPLDEPSLNEGHALFRKCLHDIVEYIPNQKLTPRLISLPPWAFKLT